MLVRRTAKWMLERLLASAVARRLARGRREGARLVLAYHNVVAPGEQVHAGDRSLHLSFDDFRSQLDILGRLGVAVVNVDQPWSSSERPEVAITFDDACVGALELAVAELADRGLPATVFVAPAMLGTSAPWWDLLASPVTGAVPALIRDRALTECAGVAETVMREAAFLGWPVGPSSHIFRIGLEADLDEALNRHESLTLGAHSWSHPNLSRLDPTLLAMELTLPLDWLRARWAARTIPWLAYPYGIDSPAVQTAVSRAGYRGALRVRGGWHRESSNRFATPRYNVASGTSRFGFEARVGGLFPC